MQFEKADDIMEENLKRIFLSHGGVLRTRDLRQCGYYNQKIQKLIEDGEIEQIRRGYYQYMDENAYSEAIIIAALFPDGVVCMESALDFYGYTDRTPSAWHIAVDSKTSRRRFNISYPIVKPHFITAERFVIGITEAEIEGTKLQIYDRERTICDCLLHRNKMEAEVFAGAVRGYLSDAKRNLSRLGKYANELRVQKKVREVLGIWL